MWARGQKNGRGAGAYDVSCGDDKHGDDSVLDDLVGRLLVVIEHEKTYDEEREIYA